MHDSANLDETDLALVHGLQLQPRISWAQLAEVLDVHPATLTRRWERLSREGLAWFSCYPQPTRNWTDHAWSAGAFVEVECAPGLRGQVGERIAQLPAVWNIDATSGPRDLMLTMRAPSLVDLDREVGEVIARISGVRATRTHFFRSLVRDGSWWRLDALSDEQQRTLRTAERREPSTRPEAQDLAVLRLLGADARLPAASVARALGCAHNTAGRWIRRVLGADFTAVRCEVAHNVAGWGVAATLWLDAPQTELISTAEAIARLPEIRLCATVGSEANLAVQIWLHHMADLDRFETLLCTRFPGTRVLDRWITPRFVKRLGHLIGEDGRRRGFVSPLGDHDGDLDPRRSQQ
ncbi:Lrp/AsnC family transcriptional regulator [Salinifilum ghardaiensis]